MNFYNKISVWILYGIFFFTPLIIYPDYIVIKEFFYQPLILILLGLTFIFKGEDFINNILKNPLKLPIFIFFISCLISLIPAINKGMALDRLRNIFCFIVLFFLVSFYSQSSKEIKNNLLVFIISGTIVSIFGIYEFLGNNILGGLPVSSTLGHPNYTGEFLSMISLITLGLIIYENTILKKGVMVTLFLIITICLFMSLGRGAILGFIVGIISFIGLYIYYKLPFKLNWKKVFIFSFIIILLTSIGTFFIIKGPDFIRKTTEYTLYELGNSKSIKQRFLIWKDTLNIIKDNYLLGIGPDNFEIQYPKYRSMKESLLEYNIIITRTHNDYLQISAEHGILGILSILWFLIFLFIYSFSKIKQEVLENKIIYVGIFSGIISLLINNLFAFGFYNPVSSIVFWSFCGYMIIPKQSKNIVIKPVPIFSSIIILGLLIIFSIQNFKILKAELNIIKASSYHNVKQYNYSLYNIKQAYELKNYDRRIIQFLSNVYKQTGNYNSAKEVIEDHGIKLFPYFYSFYDVLGEIYLKYGEFKKAEILFKKSVEIYKFGGKAHYYLGVIYLSTNRLKDAISELKLSISLKGSPSKQAYNTLGIAYFQLKDFKKSYNYFSQALSLDPNNKTLKKNLEMTKNYIIH